MLDRPVLAAVLLSLLLAACTGAPPASPSASASGAEKVSIGSETTRELETVLQKKLSAATSRDLSGFQSTVDLSRPTFRRCWMEAFDETGRGSPPSWMSGTKVLRVEPYLDTYVRAYVDEGQIGVARRYFRRVEGRWVMTEPSEDELGPEKKKSVDGLDLSYRAIDEDIIDMLGKEGLATRAFLLQNARGQTQTPFALRFFPTRGAAGVSAACRVLGTHFVNDPRDPYLRFYGVWLNQKLDGVSPDMRATFQHEGLHWLQDQFIPGIAARLDWWLVEGWPDYVGQVDRSSSIRRLMCGGSVPTYKELADGPSNEPGTKPEVQSQYYSYANSMIEYLYAQFGKDAYWNLMTAYQAGVDPNENLPKVLKVTPQQFRDGWIAFAKKKYC